MWVHDHLLEARRLVMVFAMVATATIGITQVARAITIIEYQVPTPGGEPARITAGPDGNLWFVEFVDRIGKITPTGAITEYPLPTAGVLPTCITAGPDGNLWFTEQTGNQIGKITPEGSVTEYPIPTADSVPAGITTGADGNIWFLEIHARQIGRMTPTGTIVEYQLPNPENSLSWLAAGPDGNLWFTNAFNRCTLFEQDDGCAVTTIMGSIGKITPDGGITDQPPTNTITEYLLPTLGIAPIYISAGPDGNLWFTGLECDEHDVCAGHIGKITPTGTMTEYQLPRPEEGLYALAGGPDGNVWFVGSLLGKISPEGAITEYPLPTGDPVGITAGPDGNVWFADEVRNSISKVVLSPPSCLGDCDGNQSVGVDEVLTMVNMALGSADGSACPNGIAETPVTIGDILTAVNNALNGCS
jgi:streptogramin lyase